MRYAKIFLLLSLITSLCSCAIPYEQKRLMAGFSDTKINPDSVKVSFNASGYIEREGVQKEILYRCAQLTLNNGYDYFVITSSYMTPANSSNTTPGEFTEYNNTHTNIYGYYGYNYTSTQPYYKLGQPKFSRNFKADVVIKMFHGRKPSKLANSYDARELLTSMKPH